MADTQPLPCAHCGCEPMLEEHPAHSHSAALLAIVPGLPDHPRSWTIECPTSGCVALIGDTCANVIEAWNRRVAFKATIAKNAAVRFDNKVTSWSERIGEKPGVPDGVIKFAMLEEIAELRAALASRLAEVDDEGLPKLPERYVELSPFPGRKYFTAEQYRQGQRDAVAADRARREVGNWISVEDRMPAESLIKFLITGVARAGGPLGVHMAELRDGSLYFHEGDMKGGCDPCIDDVVTHWMPLPAAPSHTTNKHGA